MASCGFSQDVKNEESKKVDAFASKTGVIIKFIDYSLPSINTPFGTAETKIRKFITGGVVGYFYQISYKEKYDTETASIAYDDLIEIIKAIQQLNEEAAKDVLDQKNYIENKFITSDGFQVGYYVGNGMANWYIQFEKYGSENTILINNFSIIETAFNNAKSKIEELKQ